MLLVSVCFSFNFFGTEAVDLLKENVYEVTHYVSRWM